MVMKGSLKSSGLVKDKVCAIKVNCNVGGGINDS